MKNSFSKQPGTDRTATESVHAVIGENHVAMDSEPLLPDGLPQRSPEELVALASTQGVKPVTRFQDLLGDFWPEDEEADDFIAARRQWQRERRADSSKSY